MNEFVKNIIPIKKEYKSSPSARDGKYRCGHCGFTGYCYGVPSEESNGEPFCPKCGESSRLIPMESLQNAG